MTGFEHDRLLYTFAEAAARLSVPESWLRKRVSARVIPHTRIGRHIRFSDEQLRRIAAEGEQEPQHTERAAVRLRSAGR